MDAPESALVLGLKASRRARALLAKGRRWLERRLAWDRSALPGQTSPLAAQPLQSASLAEQGELQAKAQGGRFVLYRIVGNDLYPRHDAGQSLANLGFILEHEQPLEGCEKRWLLNRIRRPEKLRQLTMLLEEHGYGYDVIPFESTAFQAVPWDWSVLPSPGFLASAEFRQLLLHQRQGWEIALYRHKNNYLMNNNGARNRALELGRQRADWILPWDGNCFVTAAGWRELRHRVAAHADASYFHAPMQRVADNKELLDPAFNPDPRDEPQLLFAAHARECFDPAFPYGRRPKVELFWRLGLAGPWDGWPDEPWDQPRRQRPEPAPACPRAGWVARLHSGVRAGVGRAAAASVLSQQSRYSARNLAIKASINQALVPGDGQLAASAFRSHWQRPRHDRASAQQLEAQAGRGSELLQHWWCWWQQGGRPPAAAPEQLISAFSHLAWQMALAPQDWIERSQLLERLGSLWFSPGRIGLQPRLRLLGRGLAPGRLPATAPSMAAVLQLALLSDLLASQLPAAEQAPSASTWSRSFLIWRDALSDHLQGLISPAWLGERAEDQQRLQLVLALLQRHRGRPTEPVDALLRLLSLHHPEGRSAQLGCDPRLRHLSLALAEQHGLLNPGLADQLGWTPGQDPIPPLLPLPAEIRP